MARWNNWSVWGGLALIVLGLLFFIGQMLSINLIGMFWPLFIIAAGGIFFIGMQAGGRGLSALAVPGSVIVTLGLILLVQTLFNLWASWTYAWTLIITGAGVGLMIFGIRGEIPELRMAGRIVKTVGVMLFFAFGLFFELGASLLGLRSPGGIIWPVLLILFGLYVLFGRPLWGRLGGPISRSAVVSDASGVVIDGTAEGTTGLESIAASGIRRVEFYAIGDLTVIQGEREGLEIEASDVIKERIRATVRGDTLEIRLEQDWLNWKTPRSWNIGPIRYTLYVRELEQIKAAGLGNTTISGLTTQRLELDASGTGNFTLNQLTAQELRVNLSGVSDVRIDGQVSRQDVDLSGAGSYLAAHLESRAARVVVSGLGSARVAVLEDLDAHVSGTGSIEYTGSPRVNQRVSGLGSVRQIGL